MIITKETRSGPHQLDVCRSLDQVRSKAVRIVTLRSIQCIHHSCI